MILATALTLGGGEAALPAAPGGTADMPQGVWLEKKNRVTGGWRSPGYLPPCSGGRNNRCEAEICAVVRDADGAYGETAEGATSPGRY